MLIDDSLHFKTSNLTSLFSSLTLRVAKVCRNSDNSLSNLLTKIVFCSLFHLLKNHCRDLLRGILSSVDIYSRSVVVASLNFVRNAAYLIRNPVEGLTHKSLDREDGFSWICDSLSLCRITYFSLSVVGKRHHRRCGSLSFAVDDNCRLIALHHGNAGVCGS
ncbi:hypothetical protein SDC9_101249 [bioreactor metagenome]|uniref:Uncharacterized protein n=1 Tax=bioreactor metagenome TaxID=1076179 RepID=A0A645AQ65_9ZZZZ